MSESDPHWRRLWALFHEALALPASKRSEFLNRAAGDNPGLRTEVEDLLVNHDLDPDFLSEPPSLTMAALAAAEDLLGTKIGPYRITRVIGEGGMGLVYEAEQEAPMRRGVAVKLIKPGMDTDHLLARFRAERQALALMQHRNIAQVYDAGVTDGGRPYFVMELVDGVALDEYCDQHKLDVRARLRLFLAAGDAVQHAHQKGVLHRDLKPSNILVTGDGEKTSVKIIDFGISKALSGQLTSDAADTAVYGLMIGTPDYTAPELAKSLGADLDTASDVYSLGVILYKLLTGLLPRERATPAGDTVTDPSLGRDAVAPSRKLADAGAEIAAIAARRSVSPARLLRTVRGELDWIVGKAIAPERARRYPTVDALTTDIQRYLLGEAVVASPPSRIYRVRKFVGRNRLAVAFSSALAAVVLFGGITASVGWLRALEAEREASLEADRAQAVARVLTDMLEASGPLVARGRDTTLLRELADKAAADLERSELPHWFVETELRQALGTLFMQIGDYETAAGHLDRALTLARSGFGESAPQTADLWYLTGERANLAGDLETAQAHFTTAVQLHEADLAARRGQPPGGEYYSESHAGLAEVLIRYELFDRALVHASRSLELARAHSGDDLNESLNMVARVHLYRREYDPARRYYEESLAVARQRDPLDWQLAMTLGHYGVLLRRLGEFDESAQAFRESLRIFEAVVGPVHERTAAALNSLAVTLSDAGRPDEAAPLYERALRAQTASLGENHTGVADTHFNIGVNYRRLRYYDRAIGHFRRSIEIYRRHFPADHGYILETEVLIGQVKSDAADHAGAEQWLRDFLGRHDGAEPTRSPWVLEGRVALADALIAQQRDTEAQPLLLEALHDVDTFGLRDADEIRSSALHKLVTLTRASGDAASADRYQRQLDTLGVAASAE